MGIGREGTFKKTQIGDLKLGFESSTFTVGSVIRV